MSSWNLVEASSAWSQTTVPVRAATWMRMEATMEFNDVEDAIMDSSESSTHRSSSGEGGEVLALCCLVGEGKRPSHLK